MTPHPDTPPLTDPHPIPTLTEPLGKCERVFCIWSGFFISFASGVCMNASKDMDDAWGEGADPILLLYIF